MLVLGLNGVDGSFHDSSASLFADGELVFSIEEERLNRIKHTSGIPVTAVQECLARVGASIGDVDAIGFYLNPQSMFKNYFMRTVRNYWPRTFNLYRSRSSFQQLLSFDSVLRQRLSVGCRTDSYYFNHHLCHAASAFHFSQFDEAAILIIDGSGDDETASLFVGNSSGRITKKATFSRYPQSLGLFYSSIADFLGLGWVEGPGKLMELAPYGDQTFYEALREVVFDDGVYSIDMDYFSYHLNDPVRLSNRFIKLLGVPRRTRNEPLLKIHADIAGSAQLVLEDAILFMCEKAKDLTNCTNLAYAGGVALNIDANSRIYDSGLFGRISIHPASYDGGTSIGAGYLAHLEKTGHRPRSSSEVFLGTEIRVDGQIDEYCRAHGLSVTTHSENGCIASAVSRLAKREIIGWISGRMEIGPRALTHRSILSHPSVPRADVNRIKQREPFRPFAPIVLQDRLYDIFEGGPRESPHMLYKYNVRKPYHDLLAGVVHVDNSARVQTIADTPELSRTFKLLTAFAERTGLPVLLNTSFNLRGQPLVNTGIQALEVLLGTDLASVYIDNFEFAKK